MYLFKKKLVELNQFYVLLKKCISICAYTISYFNYLLLKNKSFSIIALSFVKGHAQTMWTISWTFLTTLPPWWTVLLNKLYW